MEQAIFDRVFQLHVAPLREREQIVGTIGVALDITQRKTAEERLRESNEELERHVMERTADLSAANEALRQSEQRYAGMLNAEDTFISRSNLNRELTYINDAYARAFDRKVGDDWLEIMHPDERACVLEGMKEAQNPPSPWGREVRCRVNGQWRWVFWQTSVIRDSEGKVVEIQGIGFDVHERHRAEESLRQSETHYKESAESNRRLLMELDHRVRNNLAGLLSLVSLMRHTTRDVEDFADAIEGRLRGMAQVQKLLTECAWTQVDLRTLLGSLMESAPQPACEPGRVSMDGPVVSIASDYTLPLAMILLEWLSNSCKYGAHLTPGGQVTVTWTQEQTPQGPFLKLRWRESGGPPIPSSPTLSLGSTLVKGFATRELKGQVHLRFPVSAADHLLEFPLRTPVPIS